MELMNWKLKVNKMNWWNKELLLQRDKQNGQILSNKTKRGLVNTSNKIRDKNRNITINTNKNDWAYK